MKFKLVYFVLILLNILSAADLTEKGKIILVNIKRPFDIEVLFKNNIPIISNNYDFVLIKSDSQDIIVLNELNLDYEILDYLSPINEYYYLWPLDFEAARAISNFCKILTKKGDLYIVRFENKSKLNELKRYRIELTKINFNPIVIEKSTRDLPFVSYNQTVQEIVNRVNSDSVFSFVRRLSNFQTRYSSTDSCRAAANYIKQQFEIYQLDSVYFQDYNSSYAPNVIGIKRGTIYPESIYTIICGHFDCTSQNPNFFAPGADDNGSGSTAVLEAARALQGYDFDYSIRFIGFSGEEQGLIGSNYYANQARFRGDSILGVINIDMVAFSSPNRDSASIIGKPSTPNCAPLVDYFIACADTYTLLKTQRQVIDRPRSDHASFNQYGYLAIQCRENLNISNPYYHTTGDTIGGGFNNLNFCTEVIKGAVATIASLSKPVNVGIKEAENNFPDFKIIPNPGTKIIKVNFATSNKVKIKIFDITGKIKRTYLIRENKSYLEVDISWMNPGVYFVELVRNNKKTKTKIVIR